MTMAKAAMRGWPNKVIYAQIETRDGMRLRELSIDDLFSDLDAGGVGPIAVYRFNGDVLVVWDHMLAYAAHRSALMMEGDQQRA